MRENDIHHKRCMVATSLYPYASHITSSEQLEKYIAVAKEYYINFSTSHQHEHDVIRTKDGEKNLDFPDLDNIMSLLHNQPRTPLWTSGKRGENQSTNHLVDILKPSSIGGKTSKCWKIHSKAEEVDKRSAAVEREKEMAFNRYYKILLCKLIQGKDMFTTMSSVLN